MSCQIKVHYQDRNKIFDTHHLKPDSISNGIIELSFINGHYDLVIKDIKLKQELITPIADSHRNFSNNFDVQNSFGNKKGNEKEAECEVDFEPARLTKKRVRSEVDSDGEERDFTTDQSTRRSSWKLYVKDTNYDPITPIKVVEVPSSVNGIIVYEVPMLETLKNCKGNRPCGKAITSKSVSFTDGPRLIFHCRGSYPL